MKQYDYEARLVRIRQQPNSTDWFATALAVGVMVLCIGIGLLGLLLPILPGLLFLAFAALIAAKMFPPFEKVLRRNQVFAPYLVQSANFTRLSWRGKIRFICWMTLKVVIDGFKVLFEGMRRLISFLSKD